MIKIITTHYTELKEKKNMTYINKVNGEKVYLSLSRNEDIDLYNKWLNDPEINLGFGRSHIVYNEKRQLEYIEEYNNSDNKFLFIIIRKGKTSEYDTPIGIVLLYDIDYVHGKATMGILLDPTFQSKGHGKEASKLLLEFGFNILNLNNIMLYAIEFNEKAINLYENIGFKIIGRRRKAYPINNKLYDEVYMDILKTEYNKNSSD